MKYNINDNELIYMIKENDDEAINTLFKKYEPLINKCCSAYYVFVKCIVLLYSKYRNDEGFK